MLMVILLSSILVVPASFAQYSLSEFSTFQTAEAQTPSSTTSITLGYPFKLGVNQTAYYSEEDIQLSFVNVTEDSRCPSDVQCVWAGQVSVLVELARISDGRILGEGILTHMGGNGDGGMNPGNQSLSKKSIDNYVVSLVGVMPYPISTEKIELLDYIATLILLKNDDNSNNSRTVMTSSPVVLDAQNKDRIEQMHVGQQVVVSVAVHSSFAEEKPFVSILEVRGSDDGGVTQFLAFHSGTILGNSWQDVGQSWTPSIPGTYQLRTFLLSNLTSPQILSPVVTSELTVRLQDNNNYTAGSGNDTLVRGNMTSIIQGNNQFALELYSMATATENNDNVFFSPWSISTAFALVNEGARGETAEEIQSVFGFPSDNDTRRTSFKVVLTDLSDKDRQANYTLDTANAIWIREGYKLSGDYASAARQYYDSEVNSVIFTTEQGRSQINGWVETKTNDKIKELIPPGVLDEYTRLVITNAVYFKGLWSEQFDEKNTVEEDFNVSQNRTVKVQMMKLDEPSYFKYAQTDELQILELPYQGNKVSMLILLPRQDTSDLQSLERSLSLENLSSWKNSLRNQSVIVNIPKFKLETEYTLNEMLSAMGMPSAFNASSADLSGMLAEPEQLYIQAALHKAYVEVNEQGTEAAGATGVVIGTTSFQEYPVFRADRPFIFLIQDSETGNVLFMGRVVEPS